jgi:hypothetical protein
VIYFVNTFVISVFLDAEEDVIAKMEDGAVTVLVKPPIHKAR